MNRQAKLLWMKEMLDELCRCCDQWAAADDLAIECAAEARTLDAAAELRRFDTSLAIG